MKTCRHCLHFRLHLPRYTRVGLCKKWVQTQESKGFCDWFERSVSEPVLHNVWSRNGKTIHEWTALKKGFDWQTGNPLEYWKVREIADRYGIPYKDIEKFKNNAVKQLEMQWER